MQQGDATILNEIKGCIATSIDGFVVDPIFFPGGDIGKLSICGTVNDLSVRGAYPLYNVFIYSGRRSCSMRLRENCTVYGRDS
ncbi:MAG: AIR synthase related protein [Inconstantimicrobium porci]|nr:AIR synthase related protein [Inconstantimicrobium porci]MDD6770771.1 AIR synthase related protein [Inconstantimicrobium porci]MDY5912764.1 AIR synthase related protein [Inconstantimicrobium porci]